jgi:dienelactone hydrolase
VITVAAEMVERFEKVMDDAGVRHRRELYQWRFAGWMKPDFPIYNEAVAERGWFAMFAPAEIGTAGAEENHRAFETGA